MTHQLPRVSRLIEPAILAQHPQLAEVATPDFSGFGPTEVEDAVFAWLDEQEARFGTALPLTPLADYDAPNPIEELCDMAGAERVFVFPQEDPR